MSGNYRIHLTSGASLDGDDERDTLELVTAVEDTRTGRRRDSEPGDLPWGWVWLAGFYIREEHIAAIEFVPAYTTVNT